MGNLIGRGQITIGNLVGTCECIISSSKGNLFIKKDDNTEDIELSAKIVNNTGVIEDEDGDLFHYHWGIKDNNIWVPSDQGQNQISLSENEILNNGLSVFTCEVFRKKYRNVETEISSSEIEEYEPEEIEERIEDNEIHYYITELEEYSDADYLTNDDISPIAYGEINFENTLKYWMEFNDTEGLKIFKEGSNIYTLTNNEGYFILENKVDSNDQEYTVTRGAFSASGNYFTSISMNKYGIYEEDDKMLITSTKGLDITSADIEDLDLQILFNRARGG